MQVWSVGQEDPLEKEMVTHLSMLAWEILWTQEPGGLQFMGSQKSETWPNDLNNNKEYTLYFMGKTFNVSVVCPSINYLIMNFVFWILFIELSAKATVTDLG